MIFVNALSANQGGGQTYLLQLFNNVPENVKDRVIVLSKLKNKELWKKSGLKVIVSAWASRSIVHQMLYEVLYLPLLLHKCHVQVYFAPSGIIPLWRISNYKSAVTFQNMLPFSPEEKTRYPLGYMRLRLFLLSLALFRSFKNADLILFISSYAKEVIDEHIKVRKGRSIIIPHGLNESFRYNPENPYPDILGYKYVLYVSILDVYKAQIEVVQAWKMLKEKRQKTEEKLVLVGADNQPYAQKVRSLITKLDLTRDVILLGEIPYLQLPFYYQNAKINVFASSCENCPNILLEALASARPVLCSNYPPMPEFALNAAEYFDPYKPEEISKLFLKFIDNEDLCREFGKRALECSRRFNWKITGTKTWESLWQLMGN